MSFFSLFPKSNFYIIFVFSSINSTKSYKTQKFQKTSKLSGPLPNLHRTPIPPVRSLAPAPLRSALGRHHCRRKGRALPAVQKALRLPLLSLARREAERLGPGAATAADALRSAHCVREKGGGKGTRAAGRLPAPGRGQPHACCGGRGGASAKAARTGHVRTDSAPRKSVGASEGRERAANGCGRGAERGRVAEEVQEVIFEV